MADENKEIEKTLLQLKDIDEDIRSQAALSLGWVGESDVVNPLIHVLLNDESPKVRANAAMSLGQLGYEEAVDSLIKSLNDEDHNVRGMSVYSLGLMKAKSAFDSLVDVLKNDPDREARIAAADSLAQLGEEKAIRPLIFAYINDHNKDVKSEAKESFEKLASIHGTNNIELMIKQEEAEKIKREIALHEHEREKILTSLENKEIEKKRSEKIATLILELPSQLDYAIHNESVSYEAICKHFECDDITVELALSEMPKEHFDIQIDSINRKFTVLKPQAELSDEAKEKIKLLRKKFGVIW